MVPLSGDHRAEDPTSRWNTGACIDSREIDSHGRIRQRRVFGGPTREAHQSPWLFDEITATYAHFGAGDGQQLTGRLATLFQPNLAQVLAKNRITQGWTVAGDYMTGAGTHSFRLALAGENRTGLDSLRVEMYRERRNLAALGGGVHARRSLTARVVLQGGYGDIDMNCSAMRRARASRPGRCDMALSVIVAR